jgi:hypothetical protein
VRAVSTAILPFLNGAAFDPEHVEAMGRAFDKASRSLHDKGQPAIVQEIIARRIVEVAQTGERDPDKLSLLALKKLGMDIDV